MFDELYAFIVVVVVVVVFISFLIWNNVYIMQFYKYITYKEIGGPM